MTQLENPMAIERLPFEPKMIGTCSRCGQTINEGDWILYAAGDVYCEDCVLEDMSRCELLKACGFELEVAE